MTKWPAPWLVLLCSFTRPAYAQFKVWSAIDGLHYSPWVQSENWTAAPNRPTIMRGQQPQSPRWYFQGDDFVLDDGGDCPEGTLWHWTFLLGGDNGSVIKAETTIMFLAYNGLTFWLGQWGGACDWNLDGYVDTSDYYSFIGSWLEGDADFNDDGATDSNDFFAYVTSFVGG